MSEKHLVCNGAVCQCKFGTTPDKIKVKQTDYYINENDPSQKAIANTKDIGQPFEANTFGSCKKLNNNPCKPVITEWKDFYKQVTLENKGKILLENSTASCAIGGPSSVSITFHGQTANVASQHQNKTTDDVQAQLNPMVQMNKSDFIEPEIVLPFN